MLLNSGRWRFRSYNIDYVQRLSVHPTHTSVRINCSSHTGHNRRKVLGDCKTIEAQFGNQEICGKNFAGNLDDFNTYCSHSSLLE